MSNDVFFFSACEYSCAPQVERAASRCVLGVSTDEERAIGHRPATCTIGRKVNNARRASRDWPVIVWWSGIVAKYLVFSF